MEATDGNRSQHALTSSVGKGSICRRRATRRSRPQQRPALHTREVAGSNPPRPSEEISESASLPIGSTRFSVGKSPGPESGSTTDAPRGRRWQPWSLKEASHVDHLRAIESDFEAAAMAPRSVRPQHVGRVGDHHDVARRPVGRVGLNLHFVSSNGGGMSNTTIPSAVVLALFAWLATRAVAKYGFYSSENDPE